jgi:hypothetical protein
MNTQSLSTRKPQPHIIQPQEIQYPDTDGKPMGETGIHVRAILYLYHALCNLFLRHRRTNAYVAADMFLYYEEGNPRAVKAPDVMVILGIDGTYERRSFKTWEEKAVPSVIFEISSKSTWVEDLVNKGALYLHLAVKEYYIFDPLDEFLEAPFQGMRLIDGQYEPILPNSDGSLTSLELGVRLLREGIYLRVIDNATDERIPALEETYAYEESLRASLVHETERAEQEAQRAEQEAQRAEQEAQRAEQEAQRAAKAEAENAQLRALLGQLKRDTPQ